MDLAIVFIDRESRVGWLVGWLVACLLGWLVGWLVGWWIVSRWGSGFHG